MAKYVLIPDSFKGTLSSADICRIASEEILRLEPEAEICAIPVADGGEGTVDAFLAAVGGTAGTLINLLVGFFVGLSSGATVIIAQFWGSGDKDRVSKTCLLYTSDAADD